MKFLIVLGLLPFFSASPLSSYSYTSYPSYTPYNTYNSYTPSFYWGIQPQYRTYFPHQKTIPAIYQKKQELDLQVSLMADNIISILRNLAQDPQAAQVIDRVFNHDDSVCLNNMEEVIEIQRRSPLLILSTGHRGHRGGKKTG